MVSLADYRKKRKLVGGIISGASTALSLNSYRQKNKNTEQLNRLSGYSAPEADFTIQKFAQDKNRIANLNDYMGKRFGEDGLQQDDESDEDYVKRFMTHARRFETNSIDIMGQVDYLRGANEEDRRRFGKLYADYNALPGAGEEGGDSRLRATKDYLKAAILDPINLVGFGVARLGTAIVGKMAVKEGLKRFIPKSQITRAMVGSTGAGAAYGSMYNLAQQDIERKSYMVDEETGEEKTPDTEIDLMDTAFDAVIGAGIGAGLVGAGAGIGIGAKKLFGRGDKDKGILNKIESDEVENLDPVLGPQKIDPAELEEAEELIGKAKKRFEEKKFDPKKAKEKLDKKILTEEEILRQPPIVDAKVLVELSRKMGNIVKNISEEQAKKGDPITLVERAGKDKLVSNTVKAIIENIDKIDEDVLQAALRKEGIDEKRFLDFLETTGEFAVMERMTIREAAQTLGARGALGKLRNKLMTLDPALKSRLDELYGGPEEVTSSMGGAYNFLKRLDRERRALMVTQLATTARNVATGLSVVTFETLANTMEATLYHLGKAFKGKSEGFSVGLQDWAKDSFGLLYRFVRQGQSKEIADFLLENNPRLSKIMFRTLGDVGEKESETLSSFARYANTLNITQDAFFRRAFFSDYVTKRLRRAGVDLTDLEKGGSSIFGRAKKKKGQINTEVELLRGGMEYALQNTFALMPRSGPAHHFVKFVEAFPMMPVIGTGEFPFARFMANAMSFQLKYSPINGAYGIYQGAIAGAMKGLGKKTTPQQMQEIRERLGQGMVGSAALATAIYYRENNQDTEWFNLKAKDGRTVDMRPFFPAAPYMIVADMIVKSKNGELDKLKGKDFIDGFTGAQFRAGAASYTVDKFYEVIGAEGGLDSIGTEKLGEIIGGYVGEVTSGFVTPARVVKDIVAAFDEEEAIVRDSSAIEGVGAKERGVNAFLAKFLKNVPYASQTLPEFESPTREGTIRTQSPILGQVLGLRFRERANPAEAELVRLGYKSFQILPSKGDKEADRLVKQTLGKIVEKYVGDLIKSPQYKKLSESNKKNAMQKYLKTIRSVATDFAEIEAIKAAQAEGATFTPFDRAQWSRLERADRKAANEFYMEEYGKTVEEMGEYRKGILIGRLLGRKPFLSLIPRTP